MNDRVLPGWVRVEPIALDEGMRLVLDGATPLGTLALEVAEALAVVMP